MPNLLCIWALQSPLKSCSRQNKMKIEQQKGCFIKRSHNFIMWFYVIENLWVKSMIFHFLHLCSASFFHVKLEMGFWVRVTKNYRAGHINKIIIFFSYDLKHHHQPGNPEVQSTHVVSTNILTFWKWVFQKCAAYTRGSKSAWNHCHILKMLMYSCLFTQS